MSTAAAGKSVLLGIYLARGCRWGSVSSWGSCSSRVSALQDRQRHPVPQPHGYGCPWQHPLLHVLLAALGVSSLLFPGPAEGYGLLSASSESREENGAWGRVVLGRHQPWHT